MSFYCCNEVSTEVNSSIESKLNESFLNKINLIFKVILEENKKLKNYRDKIMSQKNMPFYSNYIPSISTKNYLFRIVKYTEVEDNTLIIALIYIDRICEISKIILTPYNIHKIIFTAILLAIKYNEDRIFNELQNKIDNLENQVKTLKLENKSLVHRIIYLEELVKKLCDKESIPVNFNSLPSITISKKTPIKLSPNPNIILNPINYSKKSLPSISQSQVISNPIMSSNKLFKNLSNKEEKEETWIFYVLSSQKYTTEKILSILNITDPNKTILEISANDFVNEYSLYIKLLEKIETFNEYSYDFQSMETPQIISYFEEIFEVTLMSDTVIIIRNFPSKKSSNYEELIGIIIGLINRVQKIYDSSQEKDNDEEGGTGKMRMVLETQEDLNILNIVKNDSRFLLNIEKLGS